MKDPKFKIGDLVYCSYFHVNSLWRVEKIEEAEGYEYDPYPHRKKALLYRYKLSRQFDAKSIRSILNHPIGTPYTSGESLLTLVPFEELTAIHKRITEIFEKEQEKVKGKQECSHSFEQVATVCPCNESYLCKMYCCQPAKVEGKVKKK